MKVQYFDLKNKRAVISGGASGIGSSIVEHLCEQGVEVYFFDINKIEAQKTLKRIAKEKVEATGLSLIKSLFTFSDFSIALPYS